MSTLLSPRLLLATRLGQAYADGPVEMVALPKILLEELIQQAAGQPPVSMTPAQWYANEADSLTDTPVDTADVAERATRLEDTAPEEWITTTEASRRYHVSTETIRRGIAVKFIHAYQDPIAHHPGFRWMVLASDAELWAQNRSSET